MCPLPLAKPVILNVLKGGVAGVLGDEPKAEVLYAPTPLKSVYTYPERSPLSHSPLVSSGKYGEPGGLLLRGTSTFQTR